MSGLFKKSIQEIKRQKEKEKEVELRKETEAGQSGDFNFDDLSSSEQEKLKQRGYIKKKIQKVKKQQVWKRGRTVKEPVRRQQGPNHGGFGSSYGNRSETTSSNRTKVAFSLKNPDVQCSDIYRLLNKYKVFIEELKLSYPSGVLWFSDPDAASKCTVLLQDSELTSKASSDGCHAEVGSPQENRSNIFSRFS